VQTVRRPTRRFAPGARQAKDGDSMQPSTTLRQQSSENELRYIAADRTIGGFGFPQPDCIMSLDRRNADD
jgi:hypothetical protein